MKNPIRGGGGGWLPNGVAPYGGSRSLGDGGEQHHGERDLAVDEGPEPDEHGLRRTKGRSGGGGEAADTGHEMKYTRK